MRVLVLCSYPLRSSPGQRFRFEQYLEPLAARGHEFDVRPVLDERGMELLYRRGQVARKAALLGAGAARRLADTLRARDYDLVFIHRRAFIAGPAVFERLLAALRVPYLIDFDDAVWLPTASDANRLAAPLKFSGKLRAIVRHAELVVAGNAYLRDWALPLNPRVTVIPTTIDTALYRPRPRPQGERLCIGWSGSRTTAQHLVPLGPVLRDAQRELGARLLVVGPERFHIPGADVEVRPWREATELDDLSEMDVGVMPLPDDEWARGKCGLKALQYMALGIPTVMSPVGVNTEIAEGGAALLASTDAEWTAALERLAGDPALRAQVGAAGRARVEERYSVDVVLPLYEQALERAGGGRARG